MKLIPKYQNGGNKIYLRNNPIGHKTIVSTEPDGYTEVIKFAYSPETLGEKIFSISPVEFERGIVKKDDDADTIIRYKDKNNKYYATSNDFNRQLFNALTKAFKKYLNLTKEASRNSAGFTSSLYSY